MRGVSLGLLVLTLVYVRDSAGAQTEYFDVTSVIQNHFAETTLESKVLNDQNTSAEIKFQIMLPTEAFITHFEMEIEGRVYEGKIEEKEQAKKKYNAAKRRGHTAGLVETRAKADKIFSTSVNIEANTAVGFKLVYQQLLRKIGGKYTNKIILFGEQLSRFLTINVYICEPTPLRNITVPPILLNGVDGTVNINPSIRENRNSAQVSFVGNDQLRNAAVSARGGVFAVTYQLEKSETYSEVIVDDGYFIYFGPDIEIKPKRMIFVLDDSGSMSGHKSGQVKKAMSNIVRKLVPMDRIGVVKFSSSVRTWKDALVYATPENIRDAVKYINSRDESGGTQIWLGLERALQMMNADTEEEENDPTTNMIILLSDGQGSLSADQLIKNAEDLGRKRFAINTISFGGDADDTLLKLVAEQNHGRWKKILADLDSAIQIENYVNEIRLSESEGVHVVNYPDVVAESYSAGSFGSEIMSVGKFHDELQVYGNGPHEITFGDVSADEGIVRAQFFLDQTGTTCGGMGGNEIQNFAAKTFAMKKVQMALTDYEVEKDAGRKLILKEKAVNLSMEYKLVTPVTSMLVIKPEVEDEIEKDLAEEDAATTTTTALPTTTTPRPGRLRLQKQSRGGGGAPKWSLHSDPHFIARLSNDITVCFNWNGRDGQMVNLFHDFENSIVINGLMRGEGEKRLFVTKMMILLDREELFIEIDPDGFTVGGFSHGTKGDDDVRISLRETEQRSAVFGIVKFHVAEIKKYHVILKIRIRKILFVVEIHHQRENKPQTTDHLDLAIPDYQTVSGNLGGIFGHLQMRNFLDLGHAEIIQNAARNKTFLLYNDAKVEVHKSHMRVPYMKTHVECWFSKGHLERLLGARSEDFELESLEQIPTVA